MKKIGMLAVPGLAIAYLAVAPHGCTTTSAPTPTPTLQVTVNATISYAGTNPSGTHQLYFAINNSNSYGSPVSGWQGQGNQTSPFSTNVSMGSIVLNNGTNYALAYWSASGSTSGPQGNDPKGSASFNVNKGGGSVSVNITLL